jgi:hypothetical protein
MVQRIRFVDGTSQDEEFRKSPLPAVSNKLSTAVLLALDDYSHFMDKKLSPDQTWTFYGEMKRLLDAITVAMRRLIKHKKAAKIDKGWVVSLIEQDIPQTLGWAAKVRNRFPDYVGMTALDAVKLVRTSPLTEYVKGESAWAWARMSDKSKALLMANRDSDAAYVARVRENAKRMLAKKVPPKDILRYMADGASKFVEKVIREYVTLMGLDKEALVVVSTGSSGSGELFPYSDIDIQLMKGGLKADEVEHMELILHNIRMRIRLANMKEEGGQWNPSLGWDVDQLAQGGYDATSAMAGDPYKGLAFTRVLFATGGGESEAKALQGQQRSNRLANASETMENTLWPSVKQNDWKLKSAADLDIGAQPFEFKEKLTRLPRVYLNVLGMWHNLDTDNSWERVDELVGKKFLDARVGKQFKDYLDSITRVRMRYQFFYEEEGLDTVSPTPGKQAPKLYKKGYYILTAEDRKELKKAQAIQGVLFDEITKTRKQMLGQTV